MKQTRGIIVMLSDQQICAAVTEDRLYHVMTVTDGSVTVEDVLEGEFARSGTVCLTNKTKGNQVTLTMEEWGCGLTRAVDKVRSLRAPKRVTYATRQLKW